MVEADVPPEMCPVILTFITSFDEGDEVCIFAEAEVVVGFADRVGAEEVGALTITGFARDVVCVGVVVWGSLCGAAIASVFAGGEVVTSFLRTSMAAATEVFVKPGGSVTLLMTAVDDEGMPAALAVFSPGNVRGDIIAADVTHVADETALSTSCTAPDAVE